MNAFELLKLPLKLVISDSEIRDAFRKQASVSHPDSGGDEQDFAQLQAAQEILISPARRLKEWVLAKGLEVEARGQIEGTLMDLFQKVSEIGASGEVLIKQNSAAQSALAKALIEVKLMKQRELVQQLIEEIEAEIYSRTDSFKEVESGKIDTNKMIRDLIFLEKWRATLRGIYSRLI